MRTNITGANSPQIRMGFLSALSKHWRSVAIQSPMIGDYPAQVLKPHHGNGYFATGHKDKKKRSNRGKNVH
jgi:hypothetical protein